MNPVIKGYISYADLKNGTLTLYDIYVLNSLMSYERKETEKRVREEALNKVLNSKKG